MTRSLRVLLGVMATMTLAACSIDPVSPSAPSAPPSLNLTSTLGTSTTTTFTSTSTCSTAPVMSGNSTYIVAYAELPPCPPPSTDTVTVAPTLKLDSLSLKLSFP